MQDKALIKEAVKEALKEELGQFYIQREEHYQHHLFIAQMIKWSENIKFKILGVIIKAIVIGIIALIVGGFIFWGKSHIGGK